MSVQQHEKISKSEFKNDLGLLQGIDYEDIMEHLQLTHHDLLGTFIRHTGTNMPSLFRDPGPRMRLEWHWLKKKFNNAAM